MGRARSVTASWPTAHTGSTARIEAADTRTCRRSIAGSSSATACSRRSVPRRPPTELAEHLSRLRRSPKPRHRPPRLAGDGRRGRDRGPPRCRRPRRRGRRRVHPGHRQPRVDRRSRAAAGGAPDAHDRDPGLARPTHAGGPPRTRPAPRRQRRPPRPGEPAGRPQDQPRGLRLGDSRLAVPARTTRFLTRRRCPRRQRKPSWSGRGTRADGGGRRRARHARSFPEPRVVDPRLGGSAGLAPVEARSHRRSAGATSVPVLERRRDLPVTGSTAGR